MKSYSYIYKDIESFKEEVKKDEINVNDFLLVSIYTGEFSMDDALINVQKIKEFMPNSKFFGATANAVTCNNIQYVAKTLIIIEVFNEGLYNKTIINYSNNTPQDLAKLSLDFIRNSNSKSARIIFGGEFKHPQEFNDEFNSLANFDIKLAGGLAGDTIIENQISFIFDENLVIEKGVIIVAFNDKVSTYCDCNTANEIIGNTHTITKTSGSFINEIDNEEAVAWIKRYLNIETMKSYKDYFKLFENDPLNKFQLILNDRNSASRFIRYDDIANKVSMYSTTIPENTKFTIGYSSPSKCIDKCYDICCDIRNHPIESLMHYSCVFRMMYMNNCAKWEITPFANYNVNGAFILGEIGWNNNKNEFLNGTMVLQGLADCETYITPDFDAFVNIDNIKSDNNDLVDFVIKKQSTSKSSENQQILNELIMQQEKLKEELTINVNLNIPNLIQYQQDRITYKFNKVCIIQNDNANMLTNNLGVEGYNVLFKAFLNSIKTSISKSGYDNKLKIYSITYTAIAMVTNNDIDEKEFTEFTKNIYDLFQFFKINHDSDTMVNCFSVVTNQEYLVEVAMNLLKANASSKKHYLVSNNESESYTSSVDELKMINILNRALQNDGVVPYYQGIQDNKTNKIEKHEALMRIKDVDNKIYTPFEFMDIAKKYHMYRRISSQMIDRVFREIDLMANGTRVSINISAIDIEDNDFIDEITEKLSKLAKPENIVFEILEDESFADINKLKRLINILKSFGCQIAIDDFGKGYSNLLQITKIRPDYLKIDGDIIKSSHCNESNVIVLKTIVYLASQLKVDLVAEFVENKEIQKVVDSLNIRYSQGYLFSKPAPIS